MDNAPVPAFAHSGPRRMRGVSMVELLVVLAIAAILLGIGAASYRNITSTSRVSSEVNGLLADMQYARSEAIKQGQNVVICVSTDGIDCTASNKQWHKGWIVFVDPTGSKSTGGNSALVLRKQAAFTSSDTLTDNTTSNVTFDREGLALGLLTTMSGAGGALIPLHEPTLTVARTRCLQITNVGNVSVQQNSTLSSCT